MLSSYPLQVAIDEGLADANGDPTDDFSAVGCDRRGQNCGFYTGLQGTSMASPHVTGLAALVIQAHGTASATAGFSLDPDTVASIIERPRPTTPAPRWDRGLHRRGPSAEFNAVCEGTTADNGLYGEGIVNATAAVAR